MRDHGVFRLPLDREARHLDVGQGIEDVLWDRRAQVWSWNGIDGAAENGYYLLARSKLSGNNVELVRLSWKTQGR